MADKKVIDWESIEQDFRAGILSQREIAGQYGVSHAAIQKRAKRDGWDRDLNAKIKAKADALVARREVAKEVATANAATERQIIEANAERIAQVRGEHRSDIARVRNLGLTLLGELESQSADPVMLAQLGELMASPDENGVDKLNDLYKKIISTPSRVDSAKKVAETLRHAIGLEREAYGLDDKASGKETSGEINISF